MPEECLKAVQRDTSNLLALFSAHYQSMIFNTSSDIYHVGDMVERLRYILKEATEEISKRNPSNESPLSDFNF